MKKIIHFFAMMGFGWLILTPFLFYESGVGIVKSIIGYVIGFLFIMVAGLSIAKIVSRLSFSQKHHIIK